MRAHVSLQGSNHLFSSVKGARHLLLLSLVKALENFAPLFARSVQGRRVEARHVGLMTGPVTLIFGAIHGDESASFEAMMQVAYQLVAGEDSTTRAILDRCVVVMNVAHNPEQTPLK